MIKKNKYFVMLVIVIATTFMGQVSAKPFDTDFRVSIGVVILTVLLLRFNTVPVMFTCAATGVSIFLFRVALSYFSSSMELKLILSRHWPSAVFYIIFGLLLIFLNFREVVSKPVMCLVVIAIADIGANTVELLIRGNLGSSNLELASVGIILTGTIRAFLSYMLYLSEKFYNLLIVNKEQREKYKEFLMMRASMKSEIFFMQKSMDDIEDSMKESFSMYRYLNKKEEGLSLEETQLLKNRVLGISKGIHEIKKDYNRIISGMGNIIPDVGFTKYKNSNEIFTILQEITDKYIIKTGKDIEFSLICHRDFPIFFYSPLLSVLNNLIINAIDAIDKRGWVKVEVKEHLETIEFIVSDNGKGIKDKHMETIFKPGFSTKFDQNTGEMSTGIGLTHVKQIVEESLGGSITVDSVAGKYTIFNLMLSRKTLCVGGNDE